MRVDHIPVAPWYRHRWPWILMSGPAVVVVAGFITLYIAISTHDGLVVDDYYKQGKTINQSLHRDDVARANGISAMIRFDQIHDRVEVQLRQNADLALPTSLSLSMVHATHSGFDRVIPLVVDNNTNTRFVGALPLLRVGKWNLLLEDPAKTWRLQRELVVGSQPLPNLSLAAVPLVSPQAPSLGSSAAQPAGSASGASSGSSSGPSSGSP